jgi:hypothetical protein
MDIKRLCGMYQQNKHLSIRIFYLQPSIPVIINHNKHELIAPVAQLDRATDF